MYDLQPAQKSEAAQETLLFRHQGGEESFAKVKVPHSVKHYWEVRQNENHKGPGDLPVRRRLASPVSEITSLNSFGFYLKGFPRGGSLGLSAVLGCAPSSGPLSIPCSAELT